jgi:hypothetical protein
MDGVTETNKDILHQLNQKVISSWMSLPQLYHLYRFF